MGIQPKATKSKCDDFKHALAMLTVIDSDVDCA